MAAEDLTGRTFGKWTVLRKSEDRPYHFVCRCECGKENDVGATALRHGRSLSCRACAKRRPNPKLAQINLAKAKAKEGQMINGWYVVEALQEKKGAARLCRAICPVCGRETTVKMLDLPVVQKCANCKGICLRPHGTVNKNSSSGVTGVTLLKDGRWQAYITFRRKRYHLGFYATPEDAGTARKEAEKLVFAPSLCENEGWEEELKKQFAALRKRLRSDSATRSA